MLLQDPRMFKQDRFDARKAAVGFRFHLRHLCHECGLRLRQGSEVLLEGGVKLLQLHLRLLHVRLGLLHIRLRLQHRRQGIFQPAVS